MTISVRDFSRALRRNGMGSPAGDMLRAQASAIATTDPTTASALLAQADAVDGTSPGYLPESVVASSYTDSADSSSSSSGPSFSDISGLADDVVKLAPTVLAALQGAGVLKAPPRAVAPLPSAPMSTGTKIALGLGGAALAGGLAYALWPKSRRRR